jgi:hypothetical protein
MTNKLITLTLMACSFLSSCKTESDIKPSDSRKAENFIFYGDKERYRNGISTRGNAPSGPFTIKKVEALKNVAPHGHDILEITVSHYPECEQDFDLVWDGAVMESMPEQVNILLNSKGSCQHGQQLTEAVLRLDLDEFIGRADLVDRATFHVLNGSLASDENDQSVATWVAAGM